MMQWFFLSKASVKVKINWYFVRCNIICFCTVSYDNVSLNKVRQKVQQNVRNLQKLCIYPVSYDQNRQTAQNPIPIEVH